MHRLLFGRCLLGRLLFGRLLLGRRLLGCRLGRCRLERRLLCNPLVRDRLERLRLLGRDLVGRRLELCRLVGRCFLGRRLARRRLVGRRLVGCGLVGRRLVGCGLVGRRLLRRRSLLDWHVLLVVIVVGEVVALGDGEHAARRRRRRRCRLADGRGLHEPRRRLPRRAQRRGGLGGGRDALEQHERRLGKLGIDRALDLEAAHELGAPRHPRAGCALAAAGGPEIAGAEGGEERRAELQGERRGLGPRSVVVGRRHVLEAVAELRHRSRGQQAHVARAVDEDGHQQPAGERRRRRLGGGRARGEVGERLGGGAERERQHALEQRAQREPQRRVLRAAQALVGKEGHHVRAERVGGGGGPHAFEQRREQRRVLDAAGERVERVVARAVDEQRHVLVDVRVLREDARGLAHEHRQLRIVLVDALRERRQQLVRKLGHLALDVHEEHLEQPRRLQPLDGRPLVELGADRVDEAAEVLHDALARAQRRPRLEGRRVGQRDRARRGELVRVAVLDLLLVVLEVQLDVLDAEALDLLARHLGRLGVFVAQRRDEVGRDAHLLLVEVLGLHLGHPARDGLDHLPAHDHRAVARQVRQVVEPRLALAVELGDGHVVLEPPAGERLDELAGTAEEELLERPQHARAHGRVPVPDVRQHRLEQLHREGLHLRRADGESCDEKVGGGGRWREKIIEQGFTCFGPSPFSLTRGMSTSTATTSSSSQSPLITSGCWSRQQPSAIAPHSRRYGWISRRHLRSTSRISVTSSARTSSDGSVPVSEPRRSTITGRRNGSAPPTSDASTPFCHRLKSCTAQSRQRSDSSAKRSSSGRSSGLSWSTVSSASMRDSRVRLRTPASRAAIWFAARPRSSPLPAVRAACGLLEVFSAPSSSSSSLSTSPLRRRPMRSCDLACDTCALRAARIESRERSVDAILMYSYPRRSRTLPWPDRIGTVTSRTGQAGFRLCVRCGSTPGHGVGGCGSGRRRRARKRVGA